MRKGLSISPRSSAARPSVKELKELDVENVRMVFQSHAVRESTETAFRFYTPYIRELNQANIRAILVINQESHPGAPWVSGNWDGYHKDMRDLCYQIADHFQREKLKVSYIIWSGGDIRGESSVYYPAKMYGSLLASCYAAIRSVDKNSLIYTQGHASGAEETVRYIREWLSVSGKLPGIILNRHPYAQFIGNRPQISTHWEGRLNQDLPQFLSFGMPIAFGEIGVSEPTGFPEKEYPAIAEYLQSVYDYAMSAGVTDFIWFAYSDIMRGAGIVDFRGRPKEFIYSKFAKLPSAKQADLRGQLKTLARVNIRIGVGTMSTIITTVPAGTVVQWAEEVESKNSVAEKIGDGNKWIYVVLPDGRKGFVNAAFVGAV
jgi:hypothetical protein